MAMVASFSASITVRGRTMQAGFSHPSVPVNPYRSNRADL